MHDYLIKQIMDELNGAVDYAKKAVEVKMDHPSWCRTFMHMSDMEASHASNLKKMYEEAKVDSEEYRDGYKRIIKMFADTMEEITKIKKMLHYWDK